MKTNSTTECHRCGEKLNADRAVQLEMSNTDGKFYRAIPAGHISQGFFDFGKACADGQLAEHGTDRTDQEINDAAIVDMLVATDNAAAFIENSDWRRVDSKNTATHKSTLVHSDAAGVFVLFTISKSGTGHTRHVFGNWQSAMDALTEPVTVANAVSAANGAVVRSEFDRMKDAANFGFAKLHGKFGTRFSMIYLYESEVTKMWHLFEIHDTNETDHTQSVFTDKLTAAMQYEKLTQKRF